MKEYKVSMEEINFYSSWKNNRFNSISAQHRYTIRCTTMEQLDYCIFVLRTMDLEAKTTGKNSAFPMYIRWYDSPCVGEIVITESATQIGAYREFDQVFKEVDGSVGQSLALPDDSISLRSKRLEGHVITL